MSIKPNIKKDFPLLMKKIDGKSIVYLDNAATSQKPREVIDAISTFYKEDNANVSRSSHFLAEKSFEKYNNARKKVASFLNVSDSNEIIFIKNSTEGLNMVAFGWGSKVLSEGDVVLTTTAEHNSSIVPWKVLAKEVGAKIEYFDLNEQGELAEGWEKKIHSKVKVVLIAHASNVLGTIMPVRDVVSVAKKKGAYVVVDGSQAVSHLIVDVADINCDFYVFSGHKMLGPMGTGVLWGKKELLQEMSPIAFGGGMMKDSLDSSFDATVSLREIPERFEAGTPNVAGAVGLGAAIDYLDTIGVQNIRIHDYDITSYALECLQKFDKINILGPLDAQRRVGLVTFYFDDVHSHDIGAILSANNIAVRSGMHCSMGLYESLQVSSATRASFHVYTTKSDIDKLVEGLEKALKVLR